MGKLEYLDALKRAMAGLPPDIQARTLAYYEQRFVDGVAVGRSETEVADELGDPKKIAITLRTNAHMSAFKQSRGRNPVDLLRLLVSVVGLAIFNLFMVVPAMVYAALLAAVYVAALGFYVSGIAITSSGLAGGRELVLNSPFEHVRIGDDGIVAGAGNAQGDRREILVVIGQDGINVSSQPAPPAARKRDDNAGQAIRIMTDVASGTRTTQTLLGLCTLLGGIALFLLALVLTRYTLIGVRRYTQMNISLLKGH